jgi:hypothetical protein
LSGAGLGIAAVLLTAEGVSGVSGGDTGLASGLIYTSRQVGGALGLAGLTAIAAACGCDWSPGTSSLAATTAGIRLAFLALSKHS